MCESNPKDSMFIKSNSLYHIPSWEREYYELDNNDRSFEIRYTEINN